MKKPISLLWKTSNFKWLFEKIWDETTSSSLPWEDLLWSLMKITYFGLLWEIIPVFRKTSLSSLGSGLVFYKLPSGCLWEGHPWEELMWSSNEKFFRSFFFFGWKSLVFYEKTFVFFGKTIWFSKKNYFLVVCEKSFSGLLWEIISTFGLLCENRLVFYEKTFLISLRVSYGVFWRYFLVFYEKTFLIFYGLLWEDFFVYYKNSSWSSYIL